MAGTKLGQTCIAIITYGNVCYMLNHGITNDRGRQISKAHNMQLSMGRLAYGRKNLTAAVWMIRKDRNRKIFQERAKTYTERLN
jgi:hypothetical protein